MMLKLNALIYEVFLSQILQNTMGQTGFMDEIYSTIG
jgi:hypothetical protein